jgi:predicted trehalose synthase
VATDRDRPFIGRKTRQTTRARWASPIATGFHEVADFAQKFGLTSAEVRKLIHKHGNNRADLERWAKAMGKG